MKPVLFPLILILGILVAARAQAQPYIVLILVDDMGYSDFGCYGSKIETPNLNRLANNGITFTHVTDEIETDAKAALSFANSINTDANTNLGVTINNIKAMSYLTIYYAYKIRGATYVRPTKKRKQRILLQLHIAGR